MDKTKALAQRGDDPSVVGLDVEAAAAGPDGDPLGHGQKAVWTRTSFKMKVEAVFDANR